jgi:hypothetical protein
MKFGIYFLSLLLFSCFITVNAQSIYRENSIKYGGIEEIKTYHLYNKKTNPACDLKINFFFPETYVNQEEMLRTLQSRFVRSFFGAEYAHLSPKEATKAYAKSYEEKYKAAFEKSGIYKEEVQKADENHDDRNDYAFLYSFEKIMRNTIFFNSGNIISQVVNVYEYTGGAHGASSTRGSVLDVNTGTEIKYEDTFREDTEDAVSALLLAHLMSARNYTGQEALADAGFTFEIIRPTGNFIADDKGLTFIYNPYELGAYVLGVVEIFVPYSDLIIYMKPEATLFRWARNHHSGNLIQFETTTLHRDSTATIIQFTFPKAYYDQTTLAKLQKLFVTNAFGEAFLSSDLLEIPAGFYNRSLKNKQSPENYIQENKFQYNSNGLISYTVEISQHDNLHETFIETGFVVDIRTARNLLYNDIFKPGAEKAITALLRKKLPSNLDYNVDEIVPHNNFYINEEGIFFIYKDIKILLRYSEITNYSKISWEKLTTGEYWAQPVSPTNLQTD